MSKGTEQFKTTIQQYLEKRAESDSLFAETLKKENKSIDECVNYILSEVQKLGANGFADDEIFGMAVHYYDEDDLKAVKQNSGRVVVNHKVELSENDLADAKAEAMKLAIEEAKIEAKKTIGKKVKLSEEDLAEVKQQSIQELVIEAKEKLKQKAEKKQLKDVSADAEVQQIDLFAS
jgi:PcfK-like protein